MLAIDRAEVAPARGVDLVLRDPLDEILQRDLLTAFLYVARVRPVVPDLDPLQHQRADIGLAGEEPQQFAGRGLPVDALGGDQRHRVVAQIVAQHRAHHRACSHPGAVDALAALLPDAAHEIEILLFGMHGDGVPEGQWQCGLPSADKRKMPACTANRPHL